MSESWFEYLKEDFWPRHGTKVIAILVLAALAVFALTKHLNSSALKEAQMAEELGKGLDYIYTGKTDSALIALEGAMPSFKGLPLAKASLLTGNIYLQNSMLDNAETMYKQAISNAGSVEIISSAAEHGLAVVAMERQKYPEAISLLNNFVNKYGKRTGNLAVPTVPDAMWKLTLCYLETGDSEKAKQTAQKLVKIYGDSPIAADASKLLATL